MQSYRWVADPEVSLGGSALPVVVDGAAVSAHVIIVVKAPSWIVLREV